MRSRYAVPVLLSCLGLTHAQSGAAPEAKPYWPGTTWAGVAPEAAGLDATRLAAAAEYALLHRSTSFLVLHDGRIVAERYRAPGGPAVQRRIASASKSMVAILVGIALDEKKLQGLDQPAADFVPEWKGTPKAAITLRHFLTMTTGLDPRGFARRPPAGDQFARNLEMPLAAPPGTHWQYNTPAYRMLFRFLAKATGESFADWTKEKLLDPLGMKQTSWRSVERGGVTNYLNLSCTARDMARFGLFVMRGGRWRDRQLVSNEFFEAATSPSQRMNPAYGYLFWLNAKKGRAARGGGSARRFAGAPRDTVACLGALGQYIVAIPSRGLVIVRQGENPGAPRFAADLTLMVLEARTK